MKSIINCLLVLSLSLACLSGHSQENKLLKEFINKNDIALRSVQKYSINLTDPSSNSFVKELLVLQVAAVKAYSSDIQKSKDISYLVREKCTAFLTKYSKGSLEYLQLSDKEQLFFSSPKTIDQANVRLSNQETQQIEALDVKDPKLFDQLNTRIN